MKNSNKKNILFIVLSLDVGGLEKMVIELMKGISGNYNIILCCLEQKGTLSGDAEKYCKDIVVLNKKPGVKLGLIFRIVKLIFKNNISIVHTHNSAAHFYGSLATFFYPGCHLIHTKHGRNNPDDKGVVLLNKISSKLSDKIVTVSEDARKLTVKLESSPENKTIVIENGLDLSRYLKIDRDEMNVLKNKKIFHIGHVGRLSKEKNQIMMLDSFKLLLSVNKNCLLHLVGDGPESENLILYSEKIGINESVKFHGCINNIAEVLTQFDCFTLSSVTEGMPMSIIEAMASGLPIVATDVGGMREMVDNNKNGFLIESNNRQALMDKWLCLINDNELLTSMGKNARAKAIEKYSLSRMADEYLTTYAKL